MNIGAIITATVVVAAVGLFIGIFLSVAGKKFAVETIDKKVVKFLKDELENRGIDYRMMILPDHPTPIKLKTHVSDPVPYIIYDSTNETDKNANLTYTEENGKKTGIYIEEGYTLMNRFLGK